MNELSIPQIKKSFISSLLLTSLLHLKISMTQCNWKYFCEIHQNQSNHFVGMWSPCGWKPFSSAIKLIVYSTPSGAVHDIVPRMTRISLSVPAFFISASSLRLMPSLVSYLINRRENDCTSPCLDPYPHRTYKNLYPSNPVFSFSYLTIWASLESSNGAAYANDKLQITATMI